MSSKESRIMSLQAKHGTGWWFIVCWHFLGLSNDDDDHDSGKFMIIMMMMIVLIGKLNVDSDDNDDFDDDNVDGDDDDDIGGDDDDVVVSWWIMNLFLSSSEIEVINIFSLHRPVEESNFTHLIDNKRLLFHASRVCTITSLISL